MGKRADCTPGQQLAAQMSYCLKFENRSLESPEGFFYFATFYSLGEQRSFKWFVKAKKTQVNYKF